MRKILICMVMCLLLVGCSSGVSQEKYEALQATNNESLVALSELEEKYDKQQASYSELETIYNKLEEDFAEFQKNMEPYKNLSDAELLEQTAEANLNAEKAKIELEEMKKKEREEKALKEEEERIAKENEEKLGYETGITFDQLARTPDEYIGKKVKFTGKSIQVIEGTFNNQIRLAIDSDYDKIILIEYDKDIVSSRILEDDIITVYGLSDGLISYQSTMGGTITIPSLIIDKIDQ